MSAKTTQQELDAWRAERQAHLASERAKTIKDLLACEVQWIPQYLDQLQHLLGLFRHFHKGTGETPAQTQSQVDHECLFEHYQKLSADIALLLIKDRETATPTRSLVVEESDITPTQNPDSPIVLS